MELLKQLDEKISSYLKRTEEIRNVFQNNILEGTTNEYSRNTTNRVLRCLEDIRGISLPNSSDINDKVVESLEKEASKYISEINSYLVNQRNIVNATISKNEQLHLPEFEEKLFKEYIMDLGNKLNRDNDINEKIPNEIISKLVTHIALRNQQTNFHQHSNEVENKIRTIVNEEYKKFNDECYMSSMTVKKELIETNYYFFNEIEMEKKKTEEINNNYETMSVKGEDVVKPEVDRIPDHLI